MDEADWMDNGFVLPPSDPTDPWTDPCYKGLLLLPITTLSVLATLAMLAFFALTRYGKPELLAHTHLKLLIMLTSCSLIGMVGRYGVYFGVYNESLCSTANFLFYGGSAGDYVSGVLICLCLFWRFVLGGSALPTGRKESLVLCIPLGFGVIVGALAVACTAISPDIACGLNRPGFSAATVVFGVLFVLQALTAAITWFSLRRIISQARDVIGPDYVQELGAHVEQATTRLLMYPVVMLVCGGVGVISVYISENLYFAGFVGALVVTLGGLLNAVVFFTLDPNFRHILSKLRSADSSANETGRATPVIHAKRSVRIGACTGGGERRPAYTAGNNVITESRHESDAHE